MRVKINNQDVYLLIEQELFDNLKESVKKNNEIHQEGKKKLKLDFLVYVIDLIEKKSFENKDKLVKGHIRLKANLFKKYCWNYSKHIEFLEQNQFINRIPYSIQNQMSYGYKVIYQKPKKKNTPVSKITKHKVSDFILSKKLNIEEQEAIAETNKTSKHLTKWINSKEIDFNYNDAIAYLDNNKSLSAEQNLQRRLSCEKLKEGVLNYKRLGKDNRLHSTFTNLPKDLRKFLKHRNQNLVSLDLKSSQPFFLCALLEALRDGNVPYHILKQLKPTHRNKLLHMYTVMIPKTLETPMDIELADFNETVLNGDIYEYLGENFSEEFLSVIQTPFGNISDKYFNLSKGFKERKHFDNLRDYCKKTMLEYLYCSPLSTEKRIKETRRIFPESVNMVVDILKKEDGRNNYHRNDFSLILQNIEAYFIIDLITNVISAERPEMFMLTIHDSIICTVDNMKYVHDTMMDIFIGMLGIAPNIVPEPWFH